jgi:hypothetical protein
MNIISKEAKGYEGKKPFKINRLVEAAGVEPASEDTRREAPTCLSYLLNLIPETPTGRIFRNQAL